MLGNFLCEEGKYRAWFSSLACHSLSSLCKLGVKSYQTRMGECYTCSAKWIIRPSASPHRYISYILWCLGYFSMQLLSRASVKLFSFSKGTNWKLFLSPFPSSEMYYCIWEVLTQFWSSPCVMEILWFFFHMPIIWTVSLIAHSWIYNVGLKILAKAHS